MDCEVSSRNILPAIRKEIVAGLVGAGEKQTDVAEALDITPAAVTQYIKGKRACQLELTGEERAEVEKLVRKVLDGGKLEQEDFCPVCKKIHSRLGD